MRIVPLSPSPNQSFTMTLDGVRWGLAIKEARGVMCADVSRDGLTILSGVRILAGEALIPYRYLQTANFIFLTQNDENPQWQQFGRSQVFIFLSALEIAALPTLTVGEIVAAQKTIGYLFTDEGFYITTDAGELIEDA